ncbi:unnamed protein product, partial [Rotaria magnacalcarata]
YRQWSNRVDLAYKLLLACALLWVLILGHRLVFYTNSNGYCAAQDGPYALFDTYLEAVLSGVFSPLLVIVLACLLIRSVQNVMQRRVVPTGVIPTEPKANQSHSQQANSQLLLMLLLQSLIAIIAYVPYGAAVIYFNITAQWSKSSVRQAWELVISNIIRLLLINALRQVFMYQCFRIVPFANNS